MNTNSTAPLNEIYLNCLGCEGSPDNVRDCRSPTCSLYPFRNGVNPWPVPKRASVPVKSCYKRIHAALRGCGHKAMTGLEAMMLKVGVTATLAV